MPCGPNTRPTFSKWGSGLLAALFALPLVWSACQQRAAPDSQSARTATSTELNLARACDLRSADACLRLSHYLVIQGAERESINALLDRACDLGHAGACAAVADALLGGHRGRTRNVARALALLERACDGGEGMACEQLTDLHRAGSGL